MLKKFFSFVHFFMPSGSLVRQNTMRHLTIISSAPRYDIPERIEWNLDDRVSVEKAERIMDLLGHRLYFRENAPGVLGKHLKDGPNIEENMITIPTVIGG